MSKENNNEKTNILKIENYLLRKGFKPNLKGFDIIVEAIRLVQSDKIYLRKITTLLYPTISKNLNASSSKVQRAIQHSISVAGIFQVNSEFIARAVIELKGDRNDI